MKPGIHREQDAETGRRNWLVGHKWLLLRRVTQLLVLALFLSGPWFGLWIAKGNLSYSYTLNILPLTDPYVLLQSMFAGHLPERMALIGAAIILVFYMLVGGRVYCSWVCPMNPVTDLAGWLRERLGIKGSMHVSRQARYWVLAMTLLLAMITGTLAWELVNPVSLLHRSLIFGFGAAWAGVMAVFLFDLLIMARGWCGHLCPVGAFYSLIGKYSLLRMATPARSACDDCMDCYAVCPEPQVIRPVLKGMGNQPGANSTAVPPVILSPNCTNCGRCIDVCTKDVFVFATRFNKSEKPLACVAG